MIAQEYAESGTVDTQNLVFQGLLRHVLHCERCTRGAYCVTGGVLIKTLREASGKDA